MLIVIDGPEKAGKSTLAQAAHDRLGFFVRHWGKPETDAGWFDIPHLQQVREDLKSGRDVLYDRSWASDWVVTNLMDEARIGRDHPWATEWLFARAFDLKLIILGPGGRKQFRRRTADDQPIDPHSERELYRSYGKRFGWEVIENKYDAESVEEILHKIALVRSRSLKIGGAILK